MSDIDKQKVDDTQDTSMDKDVKDEKPEVDYDNIINYLNTNTEDKKKLFDDYYQSERDRQVTQAIETYKTNHMQLEIEKAVEEVRKQYRKDDDPVQKEIQEMKQQMLKEREEKQRLAMQNKVSNHANALNLKLGDKIEDIALIGDEVKTRNLLNWMKEAMDASFQAGRTQYVKDNGHQPTASGGDVKGWDIEALKRMTPEERKASMERIQDQLDAALEK